jgi:hypothetical protein
MVTEKKQTKRSNKKLSITLEEARENFHQDVSSLWREETKKFEDERSGEKDFDEPVTVEPVDQKDWSTATRHQNHSPKKKKESLIVIPKKNDEKMEKTMSPLEVLRSLAKETPLLDLNADSTSSTAYTFFDISRRNRSRERLVDYVGKKVRNDRYHRERNEMLLNTVSDNSNSSIPRRVALSNEGNHHESARTRLVRGVRARSARISIISLFHVSVIVTQITRMSLVSLIHTVQENHSKINTRMHTRL